MPGFKNLNEEQLKALTFSSKLERVVGPQIKVAIRVRNPGQNALTITDNTVATADSSVRRTSKLALPPEVVRFETFHWLMKLRARDFSGLDHE